MNDRFNLQPPAALRDLDLTSLIGLSVGRARAVVEAAGGQLRDVRAGQAMTMDYRPNRVTVIVADPADETEQAVVSEVFGIG